MKILKCLLDKTDMQYSVMFCLTYGKVKVNQFFHFQNFADMTSILIYILQGCLHLNSVLTVIIFHY